MRELMKRGFEVQPVIGKSLAETAETPGKYLARQTVRSQHVLAFCWHRSPWCPAGSDVSTTVRPQ
jgi:hypothetical protein